MSNYQDKNNNLDEENELQFIIGRNPVIEALKANKLIDTIYINPEAKGSITLICRLAKEKGINVKRVTETKLNNMSRGASHQGDINYNWCGNACSAAYRIVYVISINIIDKICVNRRKSI